MLKKTIFFFLLIHGFSWAQRANDCTDAIVVCGNSTIESNATGFGVQELDNTANACFFEETNSLWLRLNIAQSGDLAFVLTPDSADINVDYDFFVFGPSNSCGNFNDPIRCSTTNPVGAGLSSNLTGLRTSETDFNEGPGPDGNSFVAAIPVIAGETYYLLIDRPVGEGGFSLDWTGTSEFFEPPTFNDPGDVELCIADRDTTVDLEAVRDFISTDPDVSISIHGSRADSFDRVNPLNNLANFPVTGPFTPLFARVQGDNDCFEIIEFNITAENYINRSLREVQCDQDGNLMEQFNLNEFANTIRGLLNTPSDFNISFHADEFSADNALSPIPSTFFDTTSTTLYARIASGSDIGCFISVPIALDVVSSPIPLVAQLVQCDIDVNNSTDGISALNLNQVFSSLPDNGDYDFFFYETLADRNNDTPIASPVGYVNTTPFAQTLFYRAINNVIGCENLGEVQIQVQPTTISLNNESPFQTCDDDPSDSILEGTFDLEAIREANYPGLEAVLYATLEDATLETNPVSGSFTSVATTLYVRLENSNQCQGVEEIELLVNPTPVFDLPPSYFLCTDSPPLTISGPEGFNTYRWIRNIGGTEQVIETAQMINISEIGTYTLEVGFVYTTNGAPLHCTNRRDFEVLPSNRAIVQEVVISDALDNNTIQISVTGDGDYEFSIDGQNYQDSNFFENAPAGFITVSVRDKRGCGITQELISVIGYPRFFTPNGDNVNDFWQILGANEIFQPNTRIHIFDRYGKLLRQLRPDESGWDGKFNARELPSSDYWFKVNLEDGREFTGHFTLKR